MSSWRVMDLSEQPDGQPIPQLLVKPAFTPDSYTVYLTCLTNIWCEELDLAGIVDRAIKLQSPIEVTKQDTAQLAILLDNIDKSLSTPEHAECRLTRKGTDAITLHTILRLPEPLDSLTWEFHLHKRTSVTLKNELILPLLVSSHIQYERINDLITTIQNKDNAITRLVDSFESNNLDLAAAFPSIGGLKTGRKLIKREQAARHLPALRPFQHNVWRDETAQLVDADVTTLGLFQEALVQCAPPVPSSLQAEDGADDWLSAVPTRLAYAKPAVKISTREPALPFQPPKHGHESSPVDDDTDDEFEVHANFKTRDMAPEADKPPGSTLHNQNPEDEVSTENDDDLDQASTSQSHKGPNRDLKQQQEPHHRALPSPPTLAEPATSPPPVSTKPKGKGFRIRGRAKKETPPSLQPEETASVSNEGRSRDTTVPPTHVDTQVDKSPKKSKKPFKIGGKGKNSQEAASSQREHTVSPKSSHFRNAHSPTPKSSPPPMPNPVEEELTPVEELHEETPEEKAERKRSELKRRNEEIARKQAQAKKKKRF